MDITLSDRHAALAKKHAAEAGFGDVGEYVAYLIELENEAEADRTETIAALQESLGQLAAGKGRPLDEAIAEIAKRHGITVPDSVEDE